MDSEHSEIGLSFRFFTEISIINQLSGAMLQSVLPDGMHPSHFAILNHLTLRGDGREPARIAAAMQVTKATMSHSLKVLEAQALIAIKPNPADGRGKQVYLTEIGRNFRAEAIALVSAKFADVITPEIYQKMTALLPELAALRSHLDNNR